MGTYEEVIEEIPAIRIFNRDAELVSINDAIDLIEEFLNNSGLQARTASILNMQYNWDDPEKKGKWPKEKAYAAVFTRQNFDRVEFKKVFRENCCISKTTAVFEGVEIILDTIMDEDEETVYTILRTDENGSVETLQKVAERLGVPTELEAV